MLCPKRKFATARSCHVGRPCVLFGGICVRVYYSKDVDMALLTHLKKSMVEGEQLLRVTVPCWDSASVAGCVCGGGGRVKGRVGGGTCYKMNPVSCP